MTALLSCCNMAECVPLGESVISLLKFINLTFKFSSVRGLPASNWAAGHHFIETSYGGRGEGHLEVVLQRLGAQDCHHGPVDGYVRNQ